MKTAATNLRLTPRERDGIRAAVQKACGETGAVWRRVLVFGSRTDPNRRGGDIDLLSLSWSQPDRLTRFA